MKNNIIVTYSIKFGNTIFYFFIYYFYFFYSNVKINKRYNIMIETICIYLLLFFTYSFLGWCLEVTCKLISDKKFINRGLLIGPICPIYGYGVLITTLLLKKYLNDPITLFILIIVSCSIL